MSDGFKNVTSIFCILISLYSLNFILNTKVSTLSDISDIKEPSKTEEIVTKDDPIINTPKPTPTPTPKEEEETTIPIPTKTGIKKVVTNPKPLQNPPAVKKAIDKKVLAYDKAELRIPKLKDELSKMNADQKKALFFQLIKAFDDKTSNDYLNYQQLKKLFGKETFNSYLPEYFAQKKK
jgi:hypothetical protein